MNLYESVLIGYESVLTYINYELVSTHHSLSIFDIAEKTSNHRISYR